MERPLWGIQFHLRLHGLWEGIIALPPPPRPPFDIDTMEPLDVPEHWGWSDAKELPPPEWWAGDETAWKAPELDLGDGTILVLDAGAPFPPVEGPAFPED